jgi:putative lipoic acid-binding regulatory protein
VSISRKIASKASMEEKWEKLREQLQNGNSWPSVYMFKFIVPADNEKIAQVENLFNTQTAEVTMRTSKNGNFVSITAQELMISPEKVIERYKEAGGIEGLISL